MSDFSPYDFHPTVYFIIWKMHAFPNQFPIVQENATKLIVWGETGKLVLILFPHHGQFFSTRFPFYDILHHMGNACVFFHHILILWYILLPQSRCMVFPIKIHSASSLIVFPQYYFLYLFQNLLIP